MEICHEADAVAPRVRREDLSSGCDLGCQLAHTNDPQRADAVWLKHVDALAAQQLAKLVRLPRHLPAGDADPAVPPQLRISLIIAAMQRLFEPVHPLGLESA